MKILTVGFVACFLACAACGRGAEAEESPPAEETADTGGEQGLPPGPTTARETMSAEACEGQGGELVGDIGDGAIHQPDYLCPNGEPPIGEVPLGVEGSVCCLP